MTFLIGWIQQVRSGFKRYQQISNWLAIIILIFSFTDIVDDISYFHPASTSPAFLFFSEIDDLIVMGIILFVAYRWSLALGQGAILLYSVLHILHYFLGYMPILDLPMRVGSIGFVSVVGIWLISRLRQTETDLRTSEKMFRNMSDSSPIGIYIVQDGKFRYVNPQFCQYTGYRQGELMGTDSLNLVVAEDREKVRDNAIQMLKGNSTVQYEYRIITKSGQIRWILETVVSILYQGKKATLGNFIDITERKKVEAELRERNKQMIALQQVSQVANQSLELEEVASMALNESLKVLNLDCGAIRYIDDVTQEIILLAHHGLTREMAGEMRDKLGIKANDGPIGEVVKSGQPIIIQDVPGYPKFTNEATRYSGFQSYIGIPLNFKGKVIGTMTCLSRQRRGFTPSDMEMLSSLGNMVGVAIANARLFGDLNRRTRELTALLTIDHGLAGDLPLQRALGGALIILTDAIGADLGTVHLFNTDKNRLELVAHHGLSTGLVEMAKKITIGDGLSEEAIERRIPVTLDISRYPDNSFNSALLREGVQTLACAPVILGERILGLINVARKHSDIFNEPELDLLQSVSSQLAVSYERTKLVQELNAGLERREAASRLTAAISSSLDLDIIFRSLTAELPRLVNFDHLALILFNGDTLEIANISREYGGLIPKGMKISSGNSMLYKVIREGKPVIRHDIEKEIVQPIDQTLLSVGIHSTLLLPLNAGGSTFGSIVIASHEVGKFSDRDLQSLKPVADQLAVALDNSKLFTQIQSVAGEWRRTFDTMSDGVAIIGANYRIRRANMALARMLSTTPQALMGRPYYEVLHGAKKPLVESPVTVCITDKVASDKEWREPHLSNRWFHMRVDPILGKDGQVNSIVQTLRDVTGEKKRQENLERLNRLSHVLSTSLNLDTVLNLALDEISPVIGEANAVVGIALLDETGKGIKGMAVRRSNGEITKGATLPLSDVPEDVTRILFEERKTWVAADLNQMRESMTKVPCSGDFKSLIAIPLVVGNRSTGALFIAGFDIYDYKPEEVTLLETYSRGIALAIENARLFSQTDEALKEQVAGVEAIISSMSEGLVAVDTQGRVAYYNQAAEQWLGLKASDFLGRPVDVFYEFLDKRVIEPANWKDALAAGIKDAVKKPRVRFVVQAHQRRELELTLFSIDNSGQQLGTGAVIRDITKEQEIDRMKTEFVSIASHELRTPMTVIYGFTELLLLRSKRLSKEHQQWIEKIFNESKRLTNIVDDFLNVSRIESGRLSVKRELLSIQNIVTPLVDQLGANYPSHTFITEVPDEFPGLWADSERLTQVMYNLMDNAAKYSPGGGEITVSALRSEDDSEAVITVTDRGLGIPEDQLSRLFTRFHRVSRPEAEGIRGTGLGLYIVKSLVNMMGGRIWVETRMNRGSTFYVALPLEKERVTT